jgi:pSer/pThr/pTyr-binding forkhead associated (FHA) protein
MVPVGDGLTPGGPVDRSRRVIAGDHRRPFHLGVRSMGDEPLDPFSEATGLSGPLIVRLEGPGSQGPPTTEFRRPFLVVGRDQLADVVIDRPEVSRRHAYFQVVAGKVFCIDLYSRTGVRWDDGARAAGWVDRARGVEIGSVRVRFEVGAADPAEQGGSLPISRSFQRGSLPEARLEFLGANSGREPWRVSRALVLIGRSPICRVQLSGAGISRIHAALVRTPAGVWVVDLLGRGGLSVGDAPARRVRLEDGDQITMGDHRLRIRLGPAAAQIPGRTGPAEGSTGWGGRPTPSTARTPASLSLDGGDAIPSRLDLSGIADPVTVRLLDEFDRMHRRTTGQFQQAILMMFRMHQDQMDLIRDELSRLDRLEDELKALRAETACYALPRPPRVTRRLVSGEASTPPPEPDSPIETDDGQAHPTGWKPAVDPVTAGPDRGERASALPSRQDRIGLESLSGPDQHALLAQRLAEIKDERQGLWKKLLSALTGDRSENGL